MSQQLLKSVVFTVFVLVGLTTTQLCAQATHHPEIDRTVATPLESLRPGLTTDHIVRELLAHNEQRKAALVEYESQRTYRVVDLKGKVHAEEIGRMEFHAPDKKTFVVTSESGSGLIRHLALNPLIASETEVASGKERHDSAIAPENYTFTLLGEQQLGPRRCFVMQAVPKRNDKYLFEGKVWIDVEDYAVARIEGHPAKKLSFWIERADFVRQYQKIGGFWLPQRDETLVQVRMYGKKMLTIDHQDYIVKGVGPANNEFTTASEARTPSVIGVR